MIVFVQQILKLAQEDFFWQGLRNLFLAEVNSGCDGR